MSSSSARAAGAAARGAHVVAASAAAAVAAWSPAAWAPAAWPPAGAPASPAADAAADADDGFTPGIAAFPAGALAAAAPAPARPRADDVVASLPDFGVHAPRAGGAAAVDAGRATIARAIEEAADAREAEVRAEYEAAWAEHSAAEADRAAAEAEAAYAAGLEAGRAEGAASAREAFAASADALDAAAAEVAVHESRWLGDLEAHVAALAVAVARHLVDREVARDDAIVAELVARAVAEFPADQPLAVRAHPADVPSLKAAWAGAPRAAELRWVPDAQVARGGALVEGRERIVDGRVDAALERVYRALSGRHA
jgi:flagellar biosynthesis/type III secretory pathway protein FliH